jgi:hypothetical protein
MWGSFILGIGLFVAVGVNNNMSQNSPPNGFMSQTVSSVVATLAVISLVIGLIIASTRFFPAT